MRKHPLTRHRCQLCIFDFLSPNRSPHAQDPQPHGSSALEISPSLLFGSHSQPQETKAFVAFLSRVRVEQRRCWIGESQVHWIGRRQFSGQRASAGELLHTPQRVPTFMATALLSLARHTVCGISVSQLQGTLSAFSVHPASPVLLTRYGPAWNLPNCRFEPTHPTSSLFRPQMLFVITTIYALGDSVMGETANRTTTVFLLLRGSFSSAVVMDQRSGESCLGTETFSRTKGSRGHIPCPFAVCCWAETHCASPVPTYIALHHTTQVRTPPFLFSFQAISHSSSNPEGNFRGNQLLGGSMSLSPLCPAPTNDLHVSNVTGIHHSFPGLHHNRA